MSETYYYKSLNRVFKDNSYCDFLNHGYYPIHNSASNIDSIFKTSASLYLTALDLITEDLKNKSLLEISCGRGGGANIIKQLYPNTTITACDYNEKSIDFCKRNFHNIQFDVCDAENLIYDTCSNDFVLNVEASHCYLNRLNFFTEVSRVLKHNGIFVYGDCFAPNSFEHEIEFSNYFIIDKKSTSHIMLQNLAHTWAIY